MGVGGSEETYNVVAEETADSVGAGHFPHDGGADDGWADVQGHDDGAGVLEFGSQPRAGENEDDLECTLRDTVCGREERVTACHTLDDEFAEICNAAVDDFVEEREEEQDPDLGVG